MAVWTPDRITALRQRGAALREMVPEPDPAELAAAQRERQALLDAEQEQATAYAAGVYQGQQVGYNPEAAAVYDSYAEINTDPDL